jgi:hypothetical protein
MQEYLATLIIHLLKAGEVKSSQINLVVFKVSDLIRSRLQCSESTFININYLLDLLDEKMS